MKAAIYTRVSTDSQAEVEFNSCEAQEAKIKAFISSQEGMEVFKVYSDQGYSGATLNRPALTELLRDIEIGNINVVIAYKVDRLTRSPRDFYQMIEIFEKYNVSFISVTERFDTSTPSGRLLRNIMLTFAQFERELVSERTKDKMLERAKKGLYGGGVCPFGYKRVNKKLVIEPSEAESVKVIYETYIKTASLFKTYDSLKSRRIFNRNNRPFTKGDLFNILRKPLYIGKLIHLGGIYPGIHDSILSDDLFNQSQELHKRRLVPKWHPAKHFLFPGLVKCAECGSTMTQTFANKIRPNKRKRYFYYRCTSIMKKDCSYCSIRQVSAVKLDRYIIESLQRIVFDNQYLESLSATLNKEASGCGKGFELSPSEPDMTTKNLKDILQRVIWIATTKDGIDKGLAMKDRIENVVYSKAAIEIKFFLSTARGSEQRPQMGGGICGRRAHRSPQKSNFGTGLSGDMEVRNQKNYWETGIRTPICRSRVCSPTVRRSPNELVRQFPPIWLGNQYI